MYELFRIGQKPGFYKVGGLVDNESLGRQRFADFESPESA